jgi:hypothetical protein
MLLSFVAATAILTSARLAQADNELGPMPRSSPQPDTSIKVAFIVDTTATMDGEKLVAVKRELQSTISKLKAVQSYNIFLLTGGDKFSAADAETSVFATPPNNRKTFAFLDAATAGGDKADPNAALALAIKQDCRLIYVLTDGGSFDSEAYKKFGATVQTKNRDSESGKQIKLNTVLLESTNEEAAKVLLAIANEAGGALLRTSLKALREAEPSTAPTSAPTTQSTTKPVH